MRGKWMRRRGAVALLLGCLTTAVAAVTLFTPTAGAVPACGGLDSGDSLAPGQSVSSCDGRYTFAHQTDGNLVLYNSYGVPLWASWTNGRATTTLVMQPEGNLVLYGPSGYLWATGYGGYPGAVFRVQDDGNLAVYPPGSPAVWNAGISRSAGTAICGVIGGCNGADSDTGENAASRCQFYDYVSYLPSGAPTKSFKDGRTTLAILELHGSDTCRGYLRAQVKVWSGTRNVDVWLERSDGARFGQRHFDGMGFFDDPWSTIWDLRFQRVRACTTLTPGPDGCTDWVDVGDGG